MIVSAAHVGFACGGEMSATVDLANVREIFFGLSRLCVREKWTDRRSPSRYGRPVALIARVRGLVLARTSLLGFLLEERERERR